MLDIKLQDFVKFEYDGQYCVGDVVGIIDSEVIVDNVVTEDGDEFDNLKISKDDIVDVMTIVKEAKEIQLSPHTEFTFQLSNLDIFCKRFGVDTAKQMLVAFMVANKHSFYSEDVVEINESNYLVFSISENMEYRLCRIFAKDFDNFLSEIIKNKQFQAIENVSGIYENEFDEDDLATFHTLIDRILATSSKMIANTMLSHLSKVAPKIVSINWYNDLIEQFELNDGGDKSLEIIKEFAKTLRKQL